MASDDDLKVFWKNVLDVAIGEAAGLQETDLLAMQERVNRILDEMDLQRKKGDLPYRDLPYREDLIQAVEAQAAVFRPGCENLVVLGTTETVRGNLAIHTALRDPMHNLLDSAKRAGPRLFVVDSADSGHFASLLDYLEGQLESTVFNIMADSNENQEIIAQLFIIRDLLTRRLGAAKARRQIIAITDAKSGTLRGLVNAEGYASLPMPAGVDEQMSILSPAGLFSAAMCGINVRELLSGAADMDRRVMRKDLRSNPAGILAATYWQLHQKGKHLHVMMPYALQMKDLCGILNAEQRASQAASIAARQPAVHIIFPRITERTVGQFIYLWQVAASITRALFETLADDRSTSLLTNEYTFALTGGPGYHGKAAELQELLHADVAYLA